MPEDVLDGIIDGLMSRKEGLGSRIAALSGSGAKTKKTPSPGIMVF